MVFFEFEKLYQDSQYDHIEMDINCYDCNVKIRATNLRYIEHLIKENFNKVYQDDGVNFSLIYRANGIVKTIFEFKGYTGRFKQEDRTTIEKEFDKIRNNRDYPWNDYTYKAFAPQTAVFNLYIDEIRKAKGWS